MQSHSNNGLHLYFLANCGILLEWHGVRILLDGLTDDDGSFDCIPPAVEQLLISGREPYHRVDLLLFTHQHFDHFSAEKTVAFLRNHPETKLMLPGTLPFELRGLLGETAKLSLPVEGANGTFCVGGDRLRIDFLRVEHITIPCPAHYCFRLSDEQESLIVTGDMDFAFWPLLAEHFSLSASPFTVFCTPLLLGREAWVNELAALHPKKVYIYHLPGADIDCHGYRKLALRRQPRFIGQLPQLELLTTPMVQLR